MELEPDRTWHAIRTIQARTDQASTPSQPLPAVTDEVEDAQELVDGTLLIAGEGGVCVASGTGCSLIVMPSAPRLRSTFTARQLVKLGDDELIAVGRDKVPGATTDVSRYRPQCARYERTAGNWKITAFCTHLDPNLRSLNAAMPYKDGLIAFSSSGAAVVVNGALAAKAVPIAGLFTTPLGAVNQFDDAVRAAAWISYGDLAALVGSDGTVRLAKLSSREGEPSMRVSRCAEKRDLGLWLNALTLGGEGEAAVTTQAGELFRLNYSAEGVQAAYSRKDGLCA